MTAVIAARPPIQAVLNQRYIHVTAKKVMAETAVTAEGVDETLASELASALANLTGSE